MRNFVVTIDGKSYSVGVEEVGEGESVTPVVSAPVAASAPAAAPKTVNANGEKVLSPFPGLIKKILVNDGDTVKKDQPIIVLEAMKMDNDITAPCDGKVTISVVKGANVETNAVLAVIG
ncbi:MAG: acetyl-CoA carboxylase biotin carboxyl carrier protein subunit [Clostridia bacterium]|nr:acetyl-CoA carboxylase biotin carboxyl carrier protein subunit [Clostridia bacterium]